MNPGGKKRYIFARVSEREIPAMWLWAGAVKGEKNHMRVILETENRVTYFS